MKTNQAEKVAFRLEDAPDSALVEWTLAGRMEAFETIMRKNNRRLFRIARGILGSDADAEDAVQECYVNAYLNLATFEGRAKLSTWLSRLVINESLGQIRRRAPVETGLPEHVLDRKENGNVVNLFGKTNTEPDEQLSGEQLTSLLERAINRLPEKFRVVFLMREVEGMSIKEIAEALESPEATIKTRNFRARKLLRADIEARFEPAIREAFLFLGERCNRMVAAVLVRIRELGAMTR